MSHEERALFVSESQEYLQILNNGLLQLEQGTDPEVVAELFRAAHSLKGMAATLGEQGVVGLTHAMEEFLSRVRETGEQLAAEDLDLLLAACDGLEAWLAAARKATRRPWPKLKRGWRLWRPACGLAFSASWAGSRRPPAKWRRRRRARRPQAICRWS